MYTRFSASQLMSKCEDELIEKSRDTDVKAALLYAFNLAVATIILSSLFR
jgi:hypothetical protein